MKNAVVYAKSIGDRLFFVKCHLLEHGEYEKWVEKNFKGGLSTARVYTRIAKYENWKKIVAYLEWITLEQAIALLRQRPEPKKEDLRRQNWIRELKQKFGQMVTQWPDKKLELSAYNIKLMGEIEKLAGEEPKKLIPKERRPNSSWRMMHRLEVQREILKEFDPQWNVTDELCKPDLFPKPSEN